MPCADFDGHRAHLLPPASSLYPQKLAHEQSQRKGNEEMNATVKGRGAVAWIIAFRYMTE